MRFGQFFTEVCTTLRDRFNWVGPETIVTKRTQCLDIIHDQYNLGNNDVQQSNHLGSEEIIRQRVYTTALEINQLRNT